MSDTPNYLKDAKELLTKDGFSTGDVWYHGTSSGLVDSIKSLGLKRSGDKAMKQAAKATMATIGNSYTESIEPVFLTQSKELAYYWAKQTVRERSVRFESDESPVVLELALPESQREKIRPDVGAASLLMVKEGEEFIAEVDDIYKACDLDGVDIDLRNADRLEYLHKLGMAYLDQDIDATYVTPILA